MSKGVSLRAGAVLLGIPIPEAEEWAREKLLSLGVIQCEMHAVANEALKIAMQKLTAIANEPTEDPRERTADLEAAKALARLAIEAMKLASANRMAPPPSSGGAGPQINIWATPGNWNLTTPK